MIPDSTDMKRGRIRRALAEFATLLLCVFVLWAVMVLAHGYGLT